VVSHFRVFILSNITDESEFSDLMKKL